MCDPVSIGVAVGGFLGGTAAFGAAGTTLTSAYLYTAAGAAGGAVAGGAAGKAVKEGAKALKPDIPSAPKTTNFTPTAPPTRTGGDSGRRRGVPSTVLTGGTGLVPPSALLGSASILGSAG